jgi:hypothetical protein
VYIVRGIINKRIMTGIINFNLKILFVLKKYNSYDAIINGRVNTVSLVNIPNAAVIRDPEKKAQESMWLEPL